MLSKLAEAALNGAALFLVGKEYVEANNQSVVWRDAYYQEREASRVHREEAVTNYNNVLNLMDQNIALLTEIKELKMKYLQLVESLAEQGIEVEEES